MGDKPILSVKNLRTYFDMAEGTVKAVQDVSFDLYRNEVLGIVGETGSGKSVTVKSIAGLIDKPGYIAGGEILFYTDEFSKDGNPEYMDLAKLKKEDFSRIRGKHIGMIFQDPMTSLDPMYTIGDQMIETIVHHEGVSEEEARERAIRLLEQVGIPKPEERIDDYPFQLSGGQRQRVVIAIALSCNPEILIADEPTTALDVTVQAQILELMKNLQQQYKSGMIFITHDLAVIAEIATKVSVMYGSYQMEIAPSETIFEKPMSPYTHALLHCIPRLDIKQEELAPIPGQPPVMMNPPKLCPFLPRCERATEKCRKELPPLEEVESGHFVRCFNPVVNKVSVVKEEIK
ncbi:peptide ABC transporter ATPase [Kosmotoga sp. DU53]|nr:ABC transporter ATP-binding protein [Kosmotoga sp. DU53]MDK2952945.1 peptide/nickel transport system ATP-binding protein [Kosmotoga sp.]OAA20143.1 peptide ABC transporter ATPase [Kosmotoga sp. DU53]